MGSEIVNFIKVWILIILSQCYCYLIGKSIPKGFKRLVLYLPILGLFIVIPLKLSSINLGGGTAFFITLLGSLKLLLLAFDKGPLALQLHPQKPFSQFLLISCFPIEIRQNSNPQKWPKYFAVKILVCAVLYPLFDYKDHFHPKVNLVLLCLLIYLMLEIVLAATAAMARAVLGLELERHFDEPYLATSLQDFWGKRWNLIVSRVLRPIVYEPGLYLWAKVVGRKWAPIPSIIGTFVVSGLFHELIYFYFGLVTPTWEVSWFFVLHGLCVSVEILAKKMWKRNRQIPTAISRPLTLGFVIWTSSWLFFPQFLRCEADVRLLQEFTALGRILKQAITNVL